MIREAIDRILDLARPVTVKVDGREYSTVPLTSIKHPDLSCVQVQSLTGLVDYLNTELLVDADQCWLEGDWFVLVQSFSEVVVLSAPVNESNQRLILAQATAPRFEFSFGAFMPMEEFIIGLQTQFLETPTRADVLKVVGNIKSDAIKTMKDDGISQRVEVAAGVTGVENVNLPNPVALKPYRTFREVEQVESLFVLRMQEGPRAALIEADGGQWKNVAALAVRSWLQEMLGPAVKVLA